MSDAVGYIILELRPASEHGKGVAWSSEQSTNLRANMPFPTIGYSPLDHGRLSTLAEWKEGEEATQDALYKRRKDIGEMLHKDFLYYLEIADKNNIPVVILQGEASRLSRKGIGFSIATTDGRMIYANTVVLALGHTPPTKYSELIGNPNYYGNPWDWKSLDGIDPKKTVGILGLGPTAVDATIVLSDKGIKKVLGFSRTGTMQYPRPKYTSQSPLFITEKNILDIYDSTGKITIDHIVALMLQEFKAANVHPDSLKNALLNSRLQPSKLLSMALPDCYSETKWFAILKLLDNVTPLIWHLFTPNERDKYLKFWRPQHTAVSYGMASPQAIRILKEINDGRFEVHGGITDKSVRETKAGFRITTKFGSKQNDYDVGAIVNCSGVGTELSSARFPVLKSMMAEGWLTRHKYGGALADFNTGQILTENREPIGELYSLVGSVMYGTRLLTHCLGETGSSALRTASAIHEKLKERRTTI
ncbi:hypothetical protein A4R29_15335 [Mesorhizobium ciceri biovar biserrulae]|nr:hypothetical protein A4R29_15335 [Mesorhizobium ciceri biovar biserrulae]